MNYFCLESVTNTVHRSIVLSTTKLAHADTATTVRVDQQGRVRRMTTITEEGVQARAKPFLTTDRDITFGDFGGPVRVTAPPDSQVKDTSGEPYWGFYF